MKEITVTYTAEITEIIRCENNEEAENWEENLTKKRATKFIEKSIKEFTNSDDVKIRDLKAFISDRREEE